MGAQELATAVQLCLCHTPPLKLLYMQTTGTVPYK